MILRFLLERRRLKLSYDYINYSFFCQNNKFAISWSLICQKISQTILFSNMGEKICLTSNHNFPPINISSILVLQLY